MLLWCFPKEEEEEEEEAISQFEGGVEILVVVVVWEERGKSFLKTTVGGLGYSSFVHSL